MIQWIIILILIVCIHDIYKKIGHIMKKINNSPLDYSDSGDEAPIQYRPTAKTSDQEEISIPMSPGNTILKYSDHDDQTTHISSGKNDSDYMSLFLTWLKQDRPMKLGGGIFIIGVGWFLSYAIQNNRISPALRIAIGIITAIFFYSIGRISTAKQKTQGSYLMSLGSAIYILSIYVGYKFFGFFGQNLSLLLIALQYILLAFCSYKSKNHRINDVSLFFSLAFPFLFLFEGGSIIGLFYYLCIHSIGNLCISYVHNRSASRLMGSIYLSIYAIIFTMGIFDSSIPELSFSIIAIIIGLALIISLLEIWIGRIILNNFSRISLTNIAYIGLGLFGYLIFLVHNNHIDTAFYLAIGIGLFVAYGILRFIYSSSNSQNAYSNVVGLLSIVYLSGVVYFRFDGLGLLLATIIIAGALEILVTIIAKSKYHSAFISIASRIIILFLLSIYYDGASNYYLSCVYTGAVVGAISSYILYSYQDTQDLSYAHFLASIGLFYFGIHIQFDGHTRILIVELVSIFWVLISYSIHTRGIRYIGGSLLSILVPSYYIFLYGISKNIFLFTEIRLIVGILLTTLYLTKRLIDTHPPITNKELHDISDLEYISMIIIGVYIYISVTYIVATQRYTLSFTIISMLLYYIGNTYIHPNKEYKGFYSLAMIIPVIASLTLFQEHSIFTVSLSNIVLSISFLWLALDTRDKLAHNYSEYILFIGALFYFWNFGYITSLEITSNQNTAIAIMLIIFTIIGILFYILGAKKENRSYTHLGTAIIIGVIARVFVVELRNMNLIMRIIICLMIGGLLIGSGFIGKKNEKL